MYYFSAQEKSFISQQSPKPGWSLEDKVKLPQNSADGLGYPLCQPVKKANHMGQN